MDLIGTKPLTGRGLASSVFVCAFLIGFMSSNAWSGSGSDRFTKDSQGIITDTKAGLQWVAGPNRPTSFNAAKDFAKTSTLGGGGWRLPNKDELLALYGTGTIEGECPGYGPKKMVFNINPVFGSGCWNIWTVDAYDSAYRYGVSFFTGKSGMESIASDRLRAFIVRKRK